jgi:hypothetical protein
VNTFYTFLTIIMAATPVLGKAVSSVSVSPYSVRETRELQLEKDASSQFSGPGSLAVTLLIEGKPVQSATHWGGVEITKAEDDQGDSLKRSQNSGANALRSFNKIDRDQMFFFEDVKPKNKIKVNIQLALPKRSSKTLAVLKGTLKLRLVQTKNVFVRRLARRVGKKVKSKTITSLGLTVKILAYNPKNPDQYIKFQVTDPKGIVEDSTLVDSSGKKLSHSRTSSGFNNVSTIELGGTKPLPPKARLQFSIRSGQKEVEVPFALKNVPLP